MSLIFNILLLVLSVSLVTFILQLSQQINGQLEKIYPCRHGRWSQRQSAATGLVFGFTYRLSHGNIPLIEVQNSKTSFYKIRYPPCYGDNHQG